ncbi:MAG: biotin/lipoate--protein ligase family protein [Loktanella sp.]|nr:biotin/lipoate--protein ligase family protein [Loktanella sp.]
MQTTKLGQILLPPPFRLHPATGPDVLAQAVALAPEHGAGTLICHAGPDLLAFAVVLEPEQKLAEAQMAFPLGMVALADALAAHCPPERSVRLVWPDELRYDKARLGGGRFAIAPGTGPDDVPDWLVFAAELIADRDHLPDPGRFPESTSLTEETFDASEDIIATFASYMMLYFDRWAHDGLDAVTNRYLMRIDPPLLRGVRRLEGDQLVEITPAGAAKRSAPLLEALNGSGWRGPQGPKL